MLGTDASDIAIGTVLQQKVKGNSQPLAFFSKKLTLAQRKYSPFDRELLAIYEAVKHFHFMVEAKPLTIWTDHKPIVAAFRKASDKCSPRQVRRFDFVSQFTTDVRYICEDDNIVADALSRIEAISGDICLNKLACSQETDTELRHLLTTSSSLDLQKIRISYSSACKVPILRNWIGRNHGTLTFRLTQVLSGHGCFGRYLCCLGREPTSGCHHCDTGDEDTVLHTLQECPAWTEQRRELVAFTGMDLSLPAVVRTMVRSRTGWDAVSSFCEHVMFAKEEAEREREHTSLLRSRQRRTRRRRRSELNLRPP
ncbi:hypothetical protein K1T71_015274 [Dendrolimus kikuchii]|nr:hypothetical protein K1T71_015274 [Dendrolimus kikuchii]